MSYYVDIFKRNLLPSRFGLGFRFPVFVDRFGSLFNRSRYESADTFSDVFGGFRDEVMGGSVQVAGNAVWKTLPRPPASTAVALLRHEDILPVYRRQHRFRKRRTTTVQGKVGRTVPRL